MTHQPLTLDTSIGIEKVAFDILLEKEPTDWAPEIISQAYRTLPFLKSYEMDAELERVDASRGYGVGKLLVYPMGMEKDAAIKDGSMVVFPIIVREKKLSPFDVFSHDGEFQPMTKEAVERALFKADVFGKPAGKDALMGTQLSNQITPPSTSTNRYAKTASVKEKTSSVLERAAPTFRDVDRHDFIVKVGSHPGVRTVFENTPALAAALLTIGADKEKTAAHLRTQRRLSTPADVVQFLEDGSGYIVKHASARCHLPLHKWMSALDVEAQIGSEHMDTLRSEGSLVLTSNPTAHQVHLEKTAQEVSTVGIYRTLSGGREVVGVVVPHTTYFDGRTSANTGVFAGQNSHALQKVAGVHLRDVTLPRCQPSGRGVFVHQDGPLGLATEPVEITNRVYEGEGSEKVASYLGTLLSTGEEVRITPTPMLKGIVKTAAHSYAIPDSMVFLPLRGKQIGLEEEPATIDRFQIEKVASDISAVDLISDGISYSLRGRNADLTYGDSVLNQEEAAFALGALGVSGEEIPKVMQKAASARQVRIYGTRRVIPEALASAAMVKSASAVVTDTRSFRCDLTKEAALLCMPKAHMIYKQASVVIDKENLDAVLSLSFITPENVSIFVEAIPEFEKSANKLAEIVVASRMGMDEVRESAACRAMKSLSDVIDGLEEIRNKIN